MKRCIFPDPERVTERLFGGLRFIDGWVSDDGERLFSPDRDKMWFGKVAHTAMYEGFNYTGHRIAAAPAPQEYP